MRLPLSKVKRSSAYTCACLADGMSFDHLLPGESARFGFFSPGSSPPPAKWPVSAKYPGYFNTTARHGYAVQYYLLARYAVQYSILARYAVQYSVFSTEVPFDTPKCFEIFCMCWVFRPGDYPKRADSPAPGGQSPARGYLLRSEVPWQKNRTTGGAAVRVGLRRCVLDFLLRAEPICLVQRGPLVRPRCLSCPMLLLSPPTRLGDSLASAPSRP
jgi:hypothetical protein